MWCYTNCQIAKLLSCRRHPHTPNYPYLNMVKRNYDSLQSFIGKFIKSRTNMGSTSQLKELLDAIAMRTTRILVQRCAMLCEHLGVRVLSVKMVQTVWKLLFGSHVEQREFYLRVDTDCDGNDVNANDTYIGILPASRFKTLIRTYKPELIKVSASCPSYVTRLVELFLGIIIDSAVTFATDRKVLNESHLMSALRVDHIEKHVKIALGCNDLFVMPFGRLPSTKGSALLKTVTHDNKHHHRRRRLKTRPTPTINRQTPEQRDSTS